MKNILLLSLFVCFSLNAQSAFTITTMDGTPIENEQTFSYNTTDADIAKLGYIVHNNTESTIIMKAQVETITGADGSNFELCFGGSCYFDVSEGLIMPLSPVAIPAGGVQGMFDHMWNKNTSSSLITYRIKFFQLDGLMNPTGEPFYVNYIYNENLSVNDVQATQSIKVLNTLVKETIQIQSEVNGKATMYSVDGKVVKALNIQSGLNNVNVSGLKPGNYILNIEGANGQKVSTKLMVK